MFSNPGSNLVEITVFSGIGNLVLYILSFTYNSIVFLIACPVGPMSMIEVSVNGHTVFARFIVRLGWIQGPVQ